MILRKLGVLGFCAGMLLFQVYTGLVETWDGDWYWPFFDYPMYSSAHHPGDIYRYAELRSIPCDPNEPPEVLDDRDVRLTRFRLYAVMDRASGLAAASVDETAVRDARRFLSRLLRARSDDLCAAELQIRAYHLGEDGYASTSATDSTVVRWTLEPGFAPADRHLGDTR